MYDPKIEPATIEALQKLITTRSDIHYLKLTWMRIYSDRPWWQFWKKRSLIGVAPVVTLEFSDSPR